MEENKGVFKGVVKQISEAKTGVSASGKDWATQEFTVVEPEGQFPQGAAFKTKPEKLQGIDEGDMVSVHFNYRLNEWQGKSYGNLEAWKIELISKVKAPDKQPIMTPNMKPEPAEPSNDLPF